MESLKFQAKIKRFLPPAAVALLILALAALLPLAFADHPLTLTAAHVAGAASVNAGEEFDLAVTLPTGTRLFATNLRFAITGGEFVQTGGTGGAAYGTSQVYSEGFTFNGFAAGAWSMRQVGDGFPDIVGENNRLGLIRVRADNSGEIVLSLQSAEIVQELDDGFSEDHNYAVSLSSTPITIAADDGSVSEDSCDGVGDACTIGQTRACTDSAGYAGTQTCNAQCTGYDAACTATESCDDGLINGNEECDGSDFGSGGASCLSYNSALYSAGMLTCSATCTFDTSGCTAVSGADVITSPPSGFALSNSDFSDGEGIPAEHACTVSGGTNTIPTLSISGAPSGTQSFALVMEDTSTATATTHLVAWDIGSSVTVINDAVIDGVNRGSNYISESTQEGFQDYAGPCPPDADAEHSYRFRLYAVSNVVLSQLAAGATLTELFTELGITDQTTNVDIPVSSQVLGIATLTGTFGSCNNLNSGRCLDQASCTAASNFWGGDGAEGKCHDSCTDWQAGATDADGNNVCEAPVSPPPPACNNDGVCDAGETTANCANDCGADTAETCSNDAECYTFSIDHRCNTNNLCTALPPAEALAQKVSAIVEGSCYPDSSYAGRRWCTAPNAGIPGRIYVVAQTGIALREYFAALADGGAVS